MDLCVFSSSSYVFDDAFKQVSLLRKRNKNETKGNTENSI